MRLFYYVVIILLVVIVLSVALANDELKVIICAVVKDEDQYIDEWILYNKYLGFDFIQIYDNSFNGSTKLECISKLYGDFVRVTHLPIDDVQKKAYKACVETYQKDNYWAAFIDVDEFIVLRKHHNIKDLLRDTVPSGGALSLNRILFGHNNHDHYSSKPVLKRFITRSKYVDHYTKTISHLPDVTLQNIHFAQLVDGKKRLDCHGREMPTSSKTAYTSEDIAAVNHYYTKSYEEFKKKRRRGNSAHSYLAEVYLTNNSETILESQFQKYNKYANELVDLRALEFFLRKKEETPSLVDSDSC